jgi:tryptophan synthase alpha chain
MRNKAVVMSHMIAGFPNKGDDLKVIQSLVDAGVSALEIQFPFSDPSADGPTIQSACNRALEGGFKVKEGFALVKKAKELAPDIPIFLMSYASIVVQKGIKAFVQEAKESGVTALIIPDLAPGSDEGLYGEAREQGLEVVPVVVPTMTEERIQEVSAWKSPYLYTAIRVGITGTHTAISNEIVAFLKRMRSGGSQVMAGFGIDNREQIKVLSPYADWLVVGSAIVRKTEEAKSSGDYQGTVGEYVRELVYGE